MPLSQGTRLGPYEILGSFGAGGQGEVYRARDTRLDRTVAIKSVRGDLGGNAVHRARVEREARILAQLTHPHICSLYDLLQEDGQTYLVMEALEGQTLAMRLLARGTRGLPLPECLATAAEVADGLAFAHQHGVVHQDVKPANIMLTAAGVKLLDFGIARLRRVGQEADVTLTAPVGEGGATGTLPYMAPEQLRGEADSRSDLFALGAVLYEMLTGARAFVAESPAALAARIAEYDPPPLAPDLAPPAVARLVARCLAKDPARRWQTATDLAEELRWLSAAGEPARPEAQALRPSRLAVLAVTSAMALASIGLWANRHGGTVRDSTVVVFKMPPPPGTSLLPYTGQAALALSPDGSQLAFVASKSDGSDRLFLRRLDQIEPRELPGTAGAEFPFWSPDGRQLGFTQGVELKRLDIDGGVSTTIASGLRGAGTWGAKGIIVIAQDGTLKRVDVRSGTVADLFAQGGTRGRRDWPAFLADGERVVYFTTGLPSRNGLYATSLTDSAETFVTAADSGAIESQGQLWFVKGSDLLRVPFDAVHLTLAGDPTVVERGLVTAAEFTSAFSVAATGVVAVITGSPNSSRLAWFDLKGERAAVVPDSEGYHNPVISPDGLRLAADRVDSRSQLSGVWLIDLKRGIGSPLTDGKGAYSFAAWSPDGTRLAYNAVPSYESMVADLNTSEVSAGPWGGIKDWTRDGRSLLLGRDSRQGHTDLYVAPLDGAPPRPIANSPAMEVDGHFSPDGRWLAYWSNGSGRWEAYLLPTTSRSTPIPISDGGGLEAKWSRDGRAIFYIALDNTLMAVDVLDPRQPTLGRPRRLFSLPIEPLASGRNHYDVGPDSGHVLVVEELATANPLAITIRTNSGYAGSR